MAVFPNPPYDITRLIQRADHQAASLARCAEVEAGIPAAIATSTLKKTENRVDGCVFIPGYSGERSESSGQAG